MRRETACFSMYSLMSKRSKWTFSTRASWRATSVLPTPVGPAKMKLPVGESGLPKPARDRLTAATTASMASSWPKTTWRSPVPSSFSEPMSEVVVVLAGIRAIFDTTFSTSTTLTIAPLRPSRRNIDPTSSMTSMALSGRKRSLM